MNIPIAGGNVSSGGNSHAANEFFVIEGAGKTYGMAGAEKSIATALYNYAGLNEEPAAVASTVASTVATSNAATLSVAAE